MTYRVQLPGYRIALWEMPGAAVDKTWMEVVSIDSEIMQQFRWVRTRLGRYSFLYCRFSMVWRPSLFHSMWWPGRRSSPHERFLSRSLLVVSSFPCKDKAAIKNAIALGPDKLRVQLVDGRVQTIEIKNFEGAGDDISIIITEARGNMIIRSETLSSSNRKTKWHIFTV